MALRVCDAHPKAMLPCPICVASLRGENLRRHIEKVHPQATIERDAPAVLIGKDRRFGRELIALLAAFLAGVSLPIALLAGGQLPDWIAISVSAVVTLLVGAISAASFGAFSARLEMNEDTILLRYALGLRRRSCRVAGPIEVGRLWEYRHDPTMRTIDTPTDTKHDAGFFVRIKDGSARITVGCPRGTAFRKHWAETDWSNASSTRFWDITLSREEMVALEYGLVARSLLKPRSDSGR